MPMKTGSEVVVKLRSLHVGDEALIDGVLWTRFPEGEYKVSPKYSVGDYDTGCYWVDKADLEENFAPTGTFEVA
jgi:hypothetical protein